MDFQFFLSNDSSRLSSPLSDRLKTSSLRALLFFLRRLQHTLSALARQPCWWWITSAAKFEARFMTNCFLFKRLTLFYAEMSFLCAFPSLPSLLNCFMFSPRLLYGAIERNLCWMRAAQAPLCRQLRQSVLSLNGNFFSFVSSRFSHPSSS